MAILQAARTVDKGRPLHIVTNNKRAAKRLTTDRKKHEDLGWSDTPETADIFRLAVAELRSRSARTTITYISKNRRGWQELRDTTTTARATARATRAARDQSALEDKTATSFDAPGAKLAAMSQRTAHRIIKAIDTASTPDRKATSTEVKKAQIAIERATGKTPAETQIWASLRTKDLSPSLRNFAWKGLHGAHKVGEYFNNMPSPWKELATCPRCDTVESMEHILFECSDPARALIWDLALDALEKKLGERPEPEIGTVWGATAASFQAENKEEGRGKARAFRILISESAFLIWKIRCERRIQHEDDENWVISNEEATSRWKATINGRIAIDRRLTNKTRHKRGALGTKTVLNTWRDMLDNEEGLQEDWLRHPGVLVGIGTRQRRQREEG
ncbi:hypothetical protein EXIGLDRAFT_607837 [Exidia glandulosa HHB12029]|uniref:Uncharacterized protein n=1 Tax=Exidia glandulosa HHB12029 TaxID=1314781 RepID=A0A166B3M4_EXIGL|nr:hypothetical protein EXIGLDRAFT_607837 [Exidia glandulosa HHB12029]